MFINFLKEVSNVFGVGTQEDASEFFTTLLESMAKSMKFTLNPSQPGVSSSNPTSLNTINILDEIFSFQFRSRSKNKQFFVNFYSSFSFIINFAFFKLLVVIVVVYLIHLKIPIHGLLTLRFGLINWISNKKIIWNIMLIEFYFFI